MKIVHGYEEDPGRGAPGIAKDLRAEVQCGKCFHRLGYVGARGVSPSFDRLADGYVPRDASRDAYLIALLLDERFNMWASKLTDAERASVRLEDLTESIGDRTWRDAGLTARPASGVTLRVRNHRANGWRLEARCRCGAHYLVRLERVAGPWLRRCTGWRPWAGSPFETIAHDTLPILLGIDIRA